MTTPPPGARRYGIGGANAAAGAASSLLKSLARLAHERHGLGEHAGHHRADLVRLGLGVALQVHPLDGCDGHVDRELDRVVRPRQALLSLHLLGELREAPLQLLGITEQVSESTALHVRIIDSLLHAEREARSPSRSQRGPYRRSRLAVPAFAGGFLYLLGGIIASSTLNGAPTVGLLQGLAPAFSGEVNPADSPRAAEVKFISHHAFALIAGSTLSAIAVVVLTLVLLLLVDATRFRRARTAGRLARPLVLVGGIGLAVLSSRPSGGQRDRDAQLRGWPRLLQPRRRSGR